MACDLHVVMLPWSAFGHMIPFYQLSLALAKHGIRISYISSPKNIERLPQIPSELATFVQYISLPLASVPGLPTGAEATVDLEFDEIPNLKIAYDLLQHPIKLFLLNQKPNWVISDFAAHWLPQISEGLGVELMFFSVYTATIMSFLGPPEFLEGEALERVRPSPDAMTAPPEWGAGVFPQSVAFRGYEAAMIHPGFYNTNASGITDAGRLARLLKGCRAVGVRSCSEFEGDYIDLYRKLAHTDVISVGLLPPAKAEAGNKGGTWDGALKWLDQQRDRSVIYVGFGSEYKLSKQEVYEIAYGLELSQLPFLWALRKPTWAVTDGDVLPPGFLTRTSGKGVVCLGWAPQLVILGHPSVGASLFHSGWGSIIETLQHGHTLVLLPFIIDQGLNARLIVHKGLGIEVERREDGSYTREDVANALRKAMVGDDDAKKIAHRASQAATIFGDRKLHEEYIRLFVDYLRNGTAHESTQD